jgi:hypothetical protein
MRVFPAPSFGGRVREHVTATIRADLVDKTFELRERRRMAPALASAVVSG